MDRCAAFAHPRDVVHDPDLTVNEKRAILASRASDACAVEAAPTLRCTLGVAAVSVDEILEALRALDKEANDAGCAGRTRRELRRRSWRRSGCVRARTQLGSGNDLSRRRSQRRAKPGFANLKMANARPGKPRVQARSTVKISSHVSLLEECLRKLSWDGRPDWGHHSGGRHFAILLADAFAKTATSLQRESPVDRAGPQRSVAM